MNIEWTVDYAFQKLQENADVIKGAEGSNEATTRMRAIDTIIFDVLGWDKLKVETERYIRAEGYGDYCFHLGDNIDLVLEAKRDNIYFLLPSRKYSEQAFGFGLLAEECRSAYDAMVQAVGYATTLGSRYIAISNGHQWLLSLTYVPNQPMDERLVFVFESFDAIKERFQVFWDCFSFHAIQSNSPALGLSESRKNPAPAKLSTTIPGYPVPIDRNHLKNELSYVLSIVWDELNANDNSKDFLKKCYIFPDSSDKVFPIAKEIIEKRNRRDEQLTEEALSVQKAPQLIREYSSEKPILVLGEVGHGKSTFLKYLRLLEAENELKNYIQIDIDFLDKPDNHKEVPYFIFKQIIRQLADRYNIDITENKFTRACLNADEIIGTATYLFIVLQYPHYKSGHIKHRTAFSRASILITAAGNNSICSVPLTLLSLILYSSFDLSSIFFLTFTLMPLASELTHLCLTHFADSSNQQSSQPQQHHRPRLRNYSYRS